jgi:hypothetical protein
MTAHVLITGTLHRDPVTRTSKTGKSFVTALLRSESQSDRMPAPPGRFKGALRLGPSFALFSVWAREFL